MFINSTILSFYEIHQNELLKFVLEALNGHHCIIFCNDMVRKQKEGFSTQNSTLFLLNIPFSKSKVVRNSVQFRGFILKIQLRLIEVLPDDIEKVTSNNVFELCNKLKYSYISKNSELVE